jgi:aryl-alcohol dehydrogenase-like predicted oxidoreductase
METFNTPVNENIVMGTGTWAWGDRLYWGFGRAYEEQDCLEAFTTSIEAGIPFFDTAEVYGQGVSEKMLGKFIKESGLPCLVATKFMPYPWRLRRGALIKALRGSLVRLGLERIDLYQVHQPLPPITVETWMEGMIEAVNAGLTAAVGVSNYNLDMTRRANDALVRQGIPLTSNQVEYSLLNRKIEQNGLFRFCQEANITIIAYSPLAMGILTGKYSTANLPPGFRRFRYNLELMERAEPLILKLRRIGAQHAGKTPAQVALNWVIAKGAVPIPGAKNRDQMLQNAGALGWSLTPAEVAELDDVSDEVTGKENDSFPSF